MKETTLIPEKEIKGWGIDIDPQDRPAYPMRKDDGIHNPDLAPLKRPKLQKSDVEILHSNERPTLSAVFGTPNPPKGISGSMRRLAFKYSESDMRHWMFLLFADRVNMIEGLFEDFSKGHFPNFYKEMGLGAEKKYNKKGRMKRIRTAGVAGITFLVLIFL